MPKILERLVKQLKDKGHDESSAYAIATASLQRSGNLKKGSTEPTAKGKRRGEMSAEERAKDRAVKYHGGSANDYSYSRKTNRTRKR